MLEGPGGACRGGARGGEGRLPSRAHPAGRWGNPSLRPASRRALGEEAGMDHLSGLGDLALADRMRSVCVFCLFLKSASLQIHA